MLCGCASKFAELPPPLQVALPEICEKILEPVDMPDVGPDDDAHDAFVKDEAALIVANERIKAGKACVRDLRQEYAGHGDN
jgi:hypothetical protein